MAYFFKTLTYKCNYMILVLIFREIQRLFSLQLKTEKSNGKITQQKIQTQSDYSLFVAAPMLPLSGLPLTQFNVT